MPNFCNNDELKHSEFLCKKLITILSKFKEELFLILYIIFMFYSFTNAVNRLNVFSDIVNSLIVFSPLLLLLFSQKFKKTIVVLPALGGLALALTSVYATLATYDISYGTEGLLQSVYWALKNHALYPLAAGTLVSFFSIVICKKQNKTYRSV